MNIVVYYRSRPSELKYSKIAMAEQRDAVSTWLTGTGAAIRAEFVEVETDGLVRPKLRDAIALCRKTGDTLLIARVEAIGSGQPFIPRINSVPVNALPIVKRELGFITPAPASAPTGLCLHFPAVRFAATPIYLSNSTGCDIQCISIRTFSVNVNALPEQAGYDVRTIQHLTIDKLADGFSALIGHYDAILDGEEAILTDVSFPICSELRTLRFYIGKGGPSDAYVTSLR